MRYLATILGVVLSMSLFMLKKAFEINIRRQDIQLTNFSDQNPFRIFFISDIHRRTIPNRLMRQIDSEIDAVIIGGDLAERGVPLKRIQENITRLAKIGPLYYVWGNNDREVGEQHIRKYIQNVGGTILENQAICIINQKQRVWIVGIDDVSAGLADIEKSLNNVPKEDMKIFVSHTPFVFSNVKEKYKLNVLLAGHTHGGQIRLGKWGFYQKGSLIKDLDKATLISNGFGTSLIPLRYGAPAECHILSIKHKSSTNVH
ncbi:metallophosphoesterase [Paenisporosarcina antarctica]|uniref:Calcineurin-like phosphoesterase domain-containing protein n=1 Tax=Paenisporosarcina antarctica TaxID=417367 RepID=A0A4P6ZYR1_9BACL|nr:metallophosphoesterase [Paenisporosarcina antarctica]QBP41358.1 hypothetical protein E2636_09535 [Paenisporosarcina antarctica]